MVELSGKDDPFQHGFPNAVFILPAIIVAGLSGKSKIQTHSSIEPLSLQQLSQLLDLRLSMQKNYVKIRHISSIVFDFIVNL